MKRILAVIIIFSSLFLLFNDASAGNNNDQPQQEKILTAAENLFVFIKNKNYTAIWGVLSAKSQATIVKDVRKEAKKAGFENNHEDLLNDFMAGGTMAKSYWDNFLFIFNPDMVLQECKWEMGKIKQDEAEIILQYKKSEKPAILKMFKENNEWKVGLDESFGARRLNPF